MTTLYFENQNGTNDIVRGTEARDMDFYFYLHLPKN